MDLTANLPDELLLDILAESASYHSTFNSNRIQGSDCIWSLILRHKISLTLVSKRWNNLALSHLYRHVVLRQTSQLKPFMHAVSNSNLGTMVQELTLTTLCGIDPWSDLSGAEDIDVGKRACRDRSESAKSIIRTLPHLCPRLSRLNIRTDITEKLLLDIVSDPNLFRITDFHFRFNGLPDYLSFSTLKGWFPSVAGRIRQLSFDGYDPGIFQYNSSDGVVEFPVLEELRLDKEISRFPENWSLPRLTRLTIDSNKRSKWRTRAPYQEHADAQLCSFLRKFGRQIEQLTLLGQARSAPEGFLIDPVLALCPKVEYIALDLLPVVSSSQASFPGVKRIDIYPWEYEWDWERAKKPLIDSVSCFPALESIRIFCSKVDFFFLIPIPFEVDPIEVFKEACIWLGIPKVAPIDLSISPLGLDTRRISVQRRSLWIDEDHADDMQHTPHILSIQISNNTFGEEIDSNRSDL